jgi:hypothetical protein
MTTLDFTIIGGTICGAIMVAGGILLLYKGAIKLEVASKDPALTVELFEKQFKMTTQAPALGLFIIGLLFIGLSIYSARETPVTPIEVKGQTAIKEEEIKVLFRTEWPIPVSGHQVLAVLRPQIDVITLVISASGYDPHYQCYSRKELEKGLDFGTIKLSRKVDTIEAKDENIVNLPPGIIPPPVSWADH